MSTSAGSKLPIHPDTVAVFHALWQEGSEISLTRWAYREAAAVLEEFSPAQIKPFHANALPDGFPQYQEDAEPVSGSSRNSWRLLAEIRQEALQRLGVRKRMQDALAANSVRPKTPLQCMLETVINGTLPELKDLSRDELNALLIVHRWLEDILKPEELFDANAVASAFALADLLAPCYHLLAEGFVDRRSQRETLRTFLWSEKHTVPLVLYGIGGVGKSTLLAKFIVDEIELHGNRLLLVPLDVDRPGIDPLRPHTFLIESIGQIVRQYSGQASQGDLAKQTLRELGSRFALASDGSQLESSRWSEKEVYWLRMELINVFRGFLSSINLPLDSRILVTVDTFEEAQSRGGDVVETVIRLFEELTNAHPAVRVVFSGRIRATESLLFLEQLRPDAPTILLRNLDQRSSLSLLRRQIGPSQPRPGAKELQDVLTIVGRNPMCIKLAARFIRIEGTHALLSDSTRQTFFDKLEDAKIQAFLFGRILDHFQTDRIKPLAYPGLIVRRVNPEIIREVLAVPCGLELDLELSAEMLYDELAQEKTLVEPDGNGGLRYRTDLRSELLPDILKKVPKSIATEIDSRAVAYFSKRQGLSELAEEIYHRLRLGEAPDVLESRWNPGVSDFLKNSIAELPTAARLWLAGKLNITLDAETRAHADQDTWEKAAALRAERYLKAGEVDKALDAIRERSMRAPGGSLYRLEVDALRLQGEFPAALEVAQRGLQGSTGSNRVEMLLLIASLYEAHNELESALENVTEADKLCRQGDDPILSLRTMVTRIRHLRKLGRKEERDGLRAEALCLVDEQGLRGLQNYPRLLEEVAAELGKQDNTILEAAVKRLGVHARTDEQRNALAKALHSGVLGLRESDEFSPKADPLLWDQLGSSLDAAKNMVDKSDGKGLGKFASDILKAGTSNNKAFSHFTDFFRASIEKGLGKK